MRPSFGLRRLTFTLIEVLIAFGLVSLLISTLMGFYWQMNQLQIETDHVRHQAFHLRLLQSQLSNVIPRALAPKAPDLYFYISDREETDVLMKPSLVFSYDHGVDIDPNFSREILARLYVVENEGVGELWLARWPRPSCSLDASAVRRQLLMRGIKAIHFSCYSPPRNPEEENKNGEPSPPSDSWIDSWSLNYWKLPAIVKISLTLAANPQWRTREEVLELVFPLPNSEVPIIMIP